MKQTKPALARLTAVFAAYARCSADLLRPESPTDRLAGSTTEGSPGTAELDGSDRLNGVSNGTTASSYNGALGAALWTDQRRRHGASLDSGSSATDGACTPTSPGTLGRSRYLAHLMAVLRHDEHSGGSGRLRQRMTELTELASATTARPPGRLPNEALQQTRSALTTVAAALAAERRCSAHRSGLDVRDGQGPS